MSAIPPHAKNICKKWMSLVRKAQLETKNMGILLNSEITQLRN